MKLVYFSNAIIDQVMEQRRKEKMGNAPKRSASKNVPGKCQLRIAHMHTLVYSNYSNNTTLLALEK